MRKGHIISLLAALINVVLGIVYQFSKTDSRGFWGIIVLFNFFCLAFIWFGDEIGSFTVNASLGGRMPTAQTPGCMVRAAGWIALFIIMALLIWSIAGFGSETGF